MIIQNCRFCNTPLSHTVVDLGTAPLCNRLITKDTYYDAEEVFPQHVKVCSKCFLVQLPHDIHPSDIFTSDYSYFSGYSQEWLRHCERYVKTVVSRFNLDESSQVLEIASNDGSLLQYFKQMGIPCVGVEPTENTAIAARDKGIPTIGVFFTADNAHLIRQSQGPKDLIIGNNVLAHVPDINDFVVGMKRLLARTGIITMEFPLLDQMISNGAWDTIYHEHFSYLSLTTVDKIFKAHGLHIFDAVPLATHGGSVRIYACHSDEPNVLISSSMRDLLEHEQQVGISTLEYYTNFSEKVRRHKYEIWWWLANVKNLGFSIAAYGAPGKGNTLFNHCGIRQDVIDFVVEDSPHKCGKYLPGSRIPILPSEAIRQHKPDFVLITPWNWQNEIRSKLTYIEDWNGKCVVFMPTIKVL